MVDVCDHLGLAFGAVNTLVEKRPSLGPWKPELVGAALEGLLTGCRRFDPERGFKPSTYTVHWVRHFVYREARKCSSSLSVPYARRVTAPSCVSLESIVEGTEGVTVADGVADDAPSAEELLEVEERRRLVAELLDGLEPRERAILVARFGLDGEPPRTLQSIGREHGLTKERVRQLQAESLDTLRRAALRRGIERAA